ncbi:Phr family secreted Rap phosphatase inhibitor [Bacillus rhizoplanae]|uniref:Phr family secreted Rap phosphatase inhibitor n=1 Tax=Bacillus rhizoplanae TaxID=2880966 RepID=UPI003D221982
MKKFGLLITGLAITSALTISLNTFTESNSQALNRGDGGGAPAFSLGDYSDIIKQDGHTYLPTPELNRGDGGGIIISESEHGVEW